MKAVAVLAICLWPVHYWLRLPYDRKLAQYNGMMADFCEAEAGMMMGRSKACLARAKSGAPWDDPSDEAETLKCCPYPNDNPRYGSWLEQSAVWERAAQRGMRTAVRYARTRDYYGGWSLIPSSPEP